MEGKQTRGWNLYPREGRWVLSYRNGPSDWKDHRIDRKIKTRRDAERYAKAWYEEHLRLTGAPGGDGDEKPDARKIVEEAKGARETIRTLSDTWLKYIESGDKLSKKSKRPIRKATRLCFASCMRIHVLHYDIADVPVTDLLRPAVLREWLRKLKKDGRANVTWVDDGGKKKMRVERGGPMAPFTVLNVVKTLSAFFEDAMAEEWVDLVANPLKNPRVKEVIPLAQKKAQSLDGEEAIVTFPRATIEAYVVDARIPEWRRVRTLVAVLTGLNEGEISGLRWGSVKLDDPVPHVVVCNALVLRHEEGRGKDGALKNEHRGRWVPLHPLAVRELRAWKEHGWSRWVGSNVVRAEEGYALARSRKPSQPPEDRDYAFANRDRAGWRPPMAALIRADLVAIGLPDRDSRNAPFNAQATRATFATFMTEAGCPKEDLQRLLGHSRGDVAETSYVAKQSLLRRNAGLVSSLVLDAPPVVAPPGAYVLGAGPRTIVMGSRRARRTARSAAVRGKSAASALPISPETRPAKASEEAPTSGSRCRGGNGTIRAPEDEDGDLREEGAIIVESVASKSAVAHTDGAIGDVRSLPSAAPITSDLERALDLARRGKTAEARALLATLIES